ncbi:beta-Ala-His dipeptidase [Reinekea thalattae]|uniref:Cytosol non-specific dipeptidase n=1 Tax=Reinekea thalattae TaxID=2593301 RepID=A0A5C8Z2N1_9GAMM|nr:beta-Ala-His dipeptidase [Reinekea thalattae]TXR51509.1 aminoacyl-histidine dipeptidase [Reinekea thalattae]
MTTSQLPAQPAHLWQHFYELCKIPRPSGKEQAVRSYIIQLAEQRNLNYQVDKTGNLVVYVPASPGHEAAETVAIQNHMDMVTVKTGDKEHNFEQDALQLMVEDGWLTADRTTLGADNGVGAAAALAAMTDEEVIHPALELVFTVEEETGLYGASGLDASLLNATRMINLDTEDWGEVYIGCAGGYGYKATRDFRIDSADSTLKPYLVHLKGLSGGHSGLEIHRQLGNANQLLAELLIDCSDLSWALESFRGGVAHNVIAREASALVYIDPAQEGKWRFRMEQASQRWLSYLPEADQGLSWSLKPSTDSSHEVLSVADRDLLLGLVVAMPHGAQNYSFAQPADLVNLSCNLAVVNLVAGQLTIQTSLRFFNANETSGLKYKIENIFKAYALEMEVILDYPGWNPNFDSALVAQAAGIAEQVTGEQAQLKAIHAGLECGILLSKKPDMDVVSFGPTIRGAHSPSERLEISTVEPFWQMLTLLLKELAA